jgi:hypothetical protein
MATDVDVHTKRPRTPNDQYTVLTTEQLRHIRTNPSTFFAIQNLHEGPSVNGPPREGGRYYRDRYCHILNGGLARNLERTSSVLYVGDQIRPHDIPVPHDTCRGLASAKWGPQRIGERTRSHFFGEQVEDYTTIDMYRRPATTYTGRIVMDCGRPGDGYYTQKFPDRASWNRSSAPLNCTTVMPSVYRKTYAEYDEVRKAELKARLARKDQWPEYSEFTARYTVRERTAPKLSTLELSKRHAALGQQIQEEEKQAEATRRQLAVTRDCPAPFNLTRSPTVIAN